MEYALPLDNNAKLESGYAREGEKLDAHFFGNFFDPVAGAWTVDPASTNHFIYKNTVHSLYGTYGRPWDQFGFLAGLRLEQSYIHTNQVTANLSNSTNYFRVYPTLHLNYNLTEASQLQLNYSRRVHRPDPEDLNPYPEFQDPFNLRAGNSKLQPEDIQSFEAGYQYKKDMATYLVALYYRHLSHGITDVTRYIDSNTLLTTKENLASNQSGGVGAAGGDHRPREEIHRECKLEHLLQPD